jgi:signal transduction histidine kinase
MMHDSPPHPQNAATGWNTPSAGLCGSVLVLCDNGHVTWASEGLAALLGYEDAPIFVGQSLMHLLAEAAAPQAHATAGISVSNSTHSRMNLYRILGRNHKSDRMVHACYIDGTGNDRLAGRETWLLSEVTVAREREQPTHESKNTPSGFQADAYSQRQIRAELESAKKEFSRDRDELIALLSHELRTPLTVISGYIKLLLTGRAGELTEEQGRFLEEGHKSCQRLNYFVTDLLEASHDHGRSFRITTEAASIEESIRGVIVFFLPLLEERDVSVEIEIEENVPTGRFDPARIEQVLTNLVGNAVKYTKVGSAITICARGITFESREMIEVLVTDDGPGIVKSEVARIFEPYVRGSDDQRGAGIGLGLAICRRILEAHGCGIGVERAPGRGSQFQFTIPAQSESAQVGG